MNEVKTQTKNEAKSVSINLDPISVEILKDTNVTFRDTLVNIGLRLVKNTEFYNTLLGKEEKALEKMTSLDNLSSIGTSKETDSNKPVEVTTKQETQKPKPTSTWDDL